MMQERKNDRFKLAHHRLVARALKDDPTLLDEAREVVRRWKSDGRTPSYVDAWAELLSRPVDEVRREITRRTPEAARLRVSSPFALTATRVIRGEEVGRLRRIASRPATAR